MMDDKVKVLRVIAYQKFKINIGEDDGYSDELKDIRDWADDTYIGSRERISKVTKEGKWSVYMDSHKILYYILTFDQYPDRLVGVLCQEAEAVVLKFYEGKISESEANKELRIIKDKFCNPESFDQITATKDTLEQCQIQMGSNIHDLATNAQNLDKLQLNAVEVNDTASAFQKGAGDLERIFFWRKIRFYVIVSLVAAFGLFLIYKLIS